MDAQRDGLVVDDIAAEDIWPMLIALAGTWAQAAIVHTADQSEARKIHNRRRRALEATARRAFCPATSPCVDEWGWADVSVRRHRQR